MHRLKEAREDYKGIAVIGRMNGGNIQFSPSSDPIAVMDAEDKNPDHVIHGTSLHDIIFKLDEMYPNDSDIPELSSRIDVEYVRDIYITISTTPHIESSDISNERILEIAQELTCITTGFDLVNKFNIRQSGVSLSTINEKFIIENYNSISFDPKRARGILRSRKAGKKKRINNGAIMIETLSSFASSLFYLIRSEYIFFNIVDFYKLKPSYTSWEHIILGLIEIFNGVKSEEDLSKLPFVKEFVLDHLEYVTPMLGSDKYKRPELARWIRKMKRKHYPDRLLKKSKKSA